MVQRLDQPVRLVVKGFGRELLAPEFADEVAFADVGGDVGSVLAPRPPPGVGVVVVGVDVFQKLILPADVDPGGGAGGVEPVDGLVGALVEASSSALALTRTPHKKTLGWLRHWQTISRQFCSAWAFQLSSPMYCQPGISRKTSRPSSSHASRKAGLWG